MKKTYAKPNSKYLCIRDGEYMLTKGKEYFTNSKGIILDDEGDERRFLSKQWTTDNDYFLKIFQEL